jgi:hypothetical protein
MTQKQTIPNLTKRTQMLKNLRQTRLEMEEFGLQLEEILAGLEKDIRFQKRQKLERSHQNLANPN